MAHTITAATNKVPVFGLDMSVTIATVAMPWIVTQASCTTGGGMASLTNGDGMTVARTYFNRASSSAKSYDRQLTMTVVVVKDTETNAKTANAAQLPGTEMAITSSTHPDFQDSWEIQSMDPTGTNTDHASFQITALRALSAT